MPIDFHSHLMRLDVDIAPRFLEEARQAWGGILAINMHSDFEAHRDGTRGADRVVVFGGRALHTGLTVDNRFVAECARRDPQRLVPFVALDPNEPDFMDEFERGVGDWGMQGVKLMPMYANFDPRDGRLDPLYEECQRRGLPILLHMGTTFCRDAPLRFTVPTLLEEVVERFRELRLVIAHLGHPWIAETLVLIRKQPNVWSDISALCPRPWQFYNALVQAKEYGVMRKLFFGTDFPFTTVEQTLAALRGFNEIASGTRLPRVPEAEIEALIERDSLSLVGIG